MGIIVAKFGGTSIGDGEKIKKAAESVVKEYMRGLKVVVVVSAIDKTTDDILNIVDKSIGDSVTEKQLADIISMGEITSVRVFSSTIESLGVKSEYLDPHMDNWPVTTNSDYLNAKINFKATEENSEEIIKLLDQGIIPVLCGFLGKDGEGNVTTLGRGGSDITAFLLGHCLQADEVIIVTDVGGVMSTDPNKLHISVIAVVGEGILTKTGILSNLTAALTEKNINIYGISTGQNSVTLFIDKSVADQAHEILHEVVVKNKYLSSLSLGREIAMITVASQDFIDTPGIITQITEPLRKKNINIVEISSSQTSVVIFVDWNDGKRAYEMVRSVLE